MIRIEGALQLSIDGAPARFFAEGRALRLELGRARTLLRLGGPGGVRKLAATLDRLGLTLVISRGRRTLLVLGRGVDSRVARILLRAPFVGLRAPRAEG